MSNKKYLDLTGVGNLINNVFSKFITKTEHAKEIDRLGDNINRVNDKADAAEDWCQTIEDDITDHYSTTVQMNNAITQAVSAESNSIKLEVSDTYATKNDFNNIQIGGRNQLIGSSFNNFKDTTTTMVDNTYTKYGNNSVKMIADNTSGTGSSNIYVGIYSLKQAWSLSDVIGRSITISMWIYVENIGDAKGYEFRIIYDTGGVTQWNKIDKNYQYNMPSAANLNQGWNYVYATYTIASDSTKAIFSFTNCAEPGEKSVLWISSPKAEIGNKPTGWTPAPEDIDSAIETVNTTLTTKYSNLEQTLDGFKTTLDGKAPSSHTHTKSQITDFPNSMPASDVYEWAKASSKPSYSKSEVGLGNVDNTADANKSVKYATSAGSTTTATKATQDSAGQQINTTYIKSLSVSGKVITYAKGDGTTGTITTQDTNTTNTTGSTNTSSKIFLVGATSQAASPVTYSHDTAYVGTDGCLYSNSTRVVSEVTQSTEPTIQKTGDYWIIEG